MLNKVDMNETRNVIIISVMLTMGLGGAVLSSGSFAISGGIGSHASSCGWQCEAGACFVRAVMSGNIERTERDSALTLCEVMEAAFIRCEHWRMRHDNLLPCKSHHVPDVHGAFV